MVENKEPIGVDEVYYARFNKDFFGNKKDDLINCTGLRLAGLEMSECVDRLTLEEYDKLNDEKVFIGWDNDYKIGSQKEIDEYNKEHQEAIEEGMDKLEEEYNEEMNEEGENPKSSGKKEEVKLTDEQVMDKLKEIAKLDGPLKINKELKELSKICDYTLQPLEKQLNSITKELKKSNGKVTTKDAMDEAVEMAGVNSEDEEGFNIFSKQGQAKKFISENPVYYDKAGFWWFWNKDKFKYERTDEIDILNSINSSLNIDTIKSKDRAEIINALKQEGRKNKPMDSKKTWIQFKDTIVDIETGEQFNASPKYFITNPLPYKIGSSEETPMLDKLFREWVVMDGLQDESYIKTLFEIIAYSSLSHQFLQRLFAFMGSGSNGKGVCLNIIDKFLGDDNTCTSELKVLAGNNFEASALYKKQACFFGEVDIYDLQNTNLIKKLSGEDKIRYEFKGKTPFSEESSTTCLMNTNGMPVTPDKSKGFYRRWMIIDFPHEFPTGEDILSKIPEEEFENLSKKVIRICKELYEKKCFTNEGSIEDRMKKYEDRSNPLMKFVKECCEEDYESYTKIIDIYKSLREFLKENRLKPIVISRIKKQLQSEGYEVIRKNYKIDDEFVKLDAVFGLKLAIGQKRQFGQQNRTQSLYTNDLRNTVQTVQTVQKQQKIQNNDQNQYFLDENEVEVVKIK